MALQQFVCVFAVAVILLCKGCYSQQPACLSGGQNPAGDTWPWHVLFTYLGSTFCQGSLITDQWVLTSAQCPINFYLSGAVVHLGVYGQPGLHEVTRKVEYYICHQDLNIQTYSDDICVVKLSAPVNFNYYIQPVCLAAEDSTFYDGTPSLVTYYGYNKNYYQAAILQKIDVSILGSNRCKCYFANTINPYYNYHYIAAPTENQLCAGQENGSTEGYDAFTGAALVTKNDSIWVQSGIVSLTYNKWLVKPTVYTQVSRYQKWISDRVSGVEPGFVTFTSPGNDTDFNYICPAPTPFTP